MFPIAVTFHTDLYLNNFAQVAASYYEHHFSQM